MSDNLSKRERRTESAVHAAVFGKHPAWSDFIDEPGVDTPGLIEVRRLLHLQGIKPNMESAAWDRLEPTQRLEDFDHVFVWQRGNDLILGRLRSSHDGTIAKRPYPTILCVQCTGWPLDRALGRVLPALDHAADQLRAVATAAEVRQIVEDLKTAVMADPRDPSRRAAGDEQAQLAQLAAHPDLGPDHVGLRRILYQIDQEILSLRGGKPPASRAAPAKGRLLRVPVCAPGPADAILTWTAFCRDLGLLGQGLWIIVPRGRAWVDLIVGDPDAALLFSLRADAAAVSLATQVPYKLDDTFMQISDRIIQRWQGVGKAPPRVPPPPPSPQSPSPRQAQSTPDAGAAHTASTARATSRRVILTLGVVILIAGLCVLLFAILGGG